MSTDFKRKSEMLIKEYISLIPSDPRAISHQIYVLLINEQFQEVIKES